MKKALVLRFLRPILIIRYGPHFYIFNHFQRQLSTLNVLCKSTMNWI
nr:MAG TPA: hypothetical protein [Caudoviricetes sp.]